MKREFNKLVSIILTLMMLLGNFLSFGVVTAVAGSGAGASSDPYTMAGAVGDTVSKIAVMSDTHYYAPELGTTGTAFNNYLAQDRKMLAESKAILESTIESIKNSDAQIVLACGDLTKDGELLSHQQFAEHLKQLEDAGKKVYVIDGNHDINNPDAASFNGDQVTPVANITPADFKTIYHDYGYGEAVAADPDSLSYAVDPVPGLRIIAMDSALYDTNIADDAPKTAGAFSAGRQAWIDAEIADGVARGKTVIGMMHHGVTNHFSLESQFFPEYVIQNADQVAADLSSKGMKVVFTGHYHAQDITKKQLPDNQFIFDVETGSLVTYPVPYRLVELSSDGKLTINTQRVNNINYDTGDKSFPDYAKDFLVEGLNKLVPQMLAGIIMQQQPGMSAEEAMAAANNAAAQVVAPTPYTVKDLLVNGMVGHYQGDENTDSQMRAIYQAMAASTDAMTQTLGAALLSLGTDLAPADSNVILNLNNGDTEQPIVTSPKVLINQVYGEGGSSGTPSTNSFVELYNPNASEINLNGWSLQYSPGMGMGDTSTTDNNWKKLDLNGTIPAHSSFLVRAKAANSPTTPTNLVLNSADQDWDQSFNNKGVKIVLLNNTTLLTVKNPFNIDGQGTKVDDYVDMFGVGGNDIGDNDFIDGCETTYVGEQSKQKAFRRIEFRDTDNNADDFEMIDYRTADIVSWAKPRTVSDGPWLTSGPKPGEYTVPKIAVMSDTHYYAPELGTTGTAFNNYLAKDRKMLAESKAILESTIESIKNSDAQIVLACGDLTKDGELLSHQQFAEHLKQLEDAGKKVYVIDGNHDINNPDAASFNGDQVTPAANITPADFKTIYHDYGYGEAVAADPDSLSYAVDPVPGLRIIAMDSALYDTNIADDAPKTAGAFSAGRQAWIDAEIADGVAQGKTVIGMMHHGITNHFSLESQFFPEYVIQNADQVAADLSSKGMKVVFTGHYHAQDITKKQLPDNQFIFDVETGSLVTYPVPYRLVELSSDGKLTINTHRVDTINYDTGNESFQDYAKNFLVEGLIKLVPQMLAGIIMQQQPGMSAQEAMAAANNAAEQVIAPTPYTVKDLLVNAMVAHYQGDEKTSSQMLAIYQGMAASSDAMTQTLGAALLSLGTDLAPADSNIILNLNNGNVDTPADIVTPTWSSPSLAASGITENGLTLTWSAGDDDVGVSSYKVFKDGILLDTVASSTQTYNVTGLNSATQYSFKVEAGDAAGNWSADGPSVTATTLAPNSPFMTTNKTSYVVGEDITVNFNNGPGNAKDWIGVYNSTDTPGVQGSTIWFYVNGSQTATTGVSTGSVTFKGGLSAAGNYKVEFLANDGYTKICEELAINVKSATALGPVITLSGAVPGGVATGAEITLPTASATDDVDGTVNVVVSVTDPQNNNVTLTDHKFTATMQGTYTVTYTATNSQEIAATQTYNLYVSDPGNKVTFGVISDTHVTAAKTVEQERAAQAFQFFQANNVDADVVVGDLTDRGSTSDYNTWQAIKDANKGNIKLIASMGNHEGNTPAAFTTATGDAPNANYVINGFHFITLSPGSGTFDPATGKGTTQGGSDYSYVVDWLKTQLDDAVAEDPNKPIFVFFHHPLRYTFYVSDEWYGSGLATGKGETFQSVFSQYPQAVTFSGHIHSPNNNPLSIWQDGGFTAVNTVTTSYLEMETGMVYGTVPPDARQQGNQGMLIEAEGSKVTIKNYDFVSGQYIPQTWTFDVSKPSEFPYTHARDLVAKAPVFPQNAAVRISDINDTGATVNFDQAVMEANNIGDIVHSYRYDFVNKATGTVDLSFKTWSEYYVLPMPATITQQAVGLLPSTDYEVRIYAIDAYQKTSDGYISAAFKTTGVPPVSDGPDYTGVSINNAKIVTITFSENLVSNASDLKEAVSFAADGDNYQPLGSNDTVVIKGNSLEISFTNELTGKANKIKIAANALKNETGIVQTQEIVTESFDATMDECFIATASFGSKFEPSVVLLRNFRDQFLLTNPLGKAFVKFYYHNSPSIAKVIAGNEILKIVVRVLLTPFVVLVYLLFNPVILVLSLILFGMTVIWIKKRKVIV